MTRSAAVPPAPNHGCHMPSYPCPNPACSHVFTPDQVQAAGALKCPACGQVFQFRARAAPPLSARPIQNGSARHDSSKKKTAPQVPIAKTAIPIPARKQADGSLAKPPPSREAPSAPQPLLDVDDSAGPLVQTRWPRPTRSRKHYLVLGIGVLAGVAVVVAAILTLKTVVPPGDGLSEISKITFDDMPIV